uniref:Uncharacterized protein n=2 Tax=Phaeomonas parva TaxID=124430 RepID=A0A7S1UF29_9STRA|mmetsp:Transcript_45207/g.141676  ORF Transcript_45207/g.141676 Transcript_45207/m.141676 type:complete len:217 (+) Transcript_45207:986-1636(+)
MVAAKCSAGTLTQADVTLDQFSHLDHSVKYTFASIKQDFLQTGTYNLILGVVVAAGIPTTSLPFLDGGGQPDATQFYDEANLLLQGYIDAGADFIAFWVDDGGASAVSTLTDEARFFDAVSSSPGFSGDTGEVDTLFCWVKAVRKLDTDDDDNEVCTQCAPQTAANILDIPPFPAAADPRRGEYCEVDVLAQCIGGGDDDDEAVEEGPTRRGARQG